MKDAKGHGSAAHQEGIESVVPHGWLAHLMGLDHGRMPTTPKQALDRAKAQAKAQGLEIGA